MSIEFSLSTEEEEALLERWATDIVPAVQRSFLRSGEPIMTESKDTYCPVETGALRSTGKVSVEVDAGHVVTMTFGYGGPAAPYAVYVHEINRNYRGGKTYKYLETPLKQGLPTINDNLSVDVADMLQGK